MSPPERERRDPGTTPDYTDPSVPGAAPDDKPAPVAPVAPPPPPSDATASGQGLDELRRKLEELQAQLSALSTKRDG